MVKITRTAATLFLLLNVLATRGQADWFAGSARIKITPDKPLVMAGYASRTTPYTSVKQDIWAKALVLEDETGKRVVIITTDLIGFSREVTPAIYEGIYKRTGIEQKDTLLTWSHTHSAPRLTLESSPHPGTQERDRLNSVQYTRRLQEQIIHLVDLATRSLQPVKLDWGEGFASFVMNRRQRTESGIRLGFNPSGHVDRSLPCLRVTSVDGKIIAALFQVACHNTTLGNRNYEMCGDFSGFAQSHLETKLPGTQAMFMTGCAGNANPYPRGTMEVTEQLGVELATEVARLLRSELRPISGPLTTGRTDAPLSLQAPKPRTELQEIADNGPGWLRGSASTMLEMIDEGKPLPTHYHAPVSAWQFGDDLTLLALSGEVVSGYVLETQKAIGHQKLWITAYAHDFFGYLPTAQIIREGGYETRGLFNGTGFFDEQAESDMIESIAQLAREVGRSFE